MSGVSIPAASRGRAPPGPAPVSSLSCGPRRGIDWHRSLVSTGVTRFAPMPSVVETARPRLRPWRESDAADLHALWAERDPRSLRTLDVQGRPTVEDLRANIVAQLAATADSGLALLAIDRRLEGDFIGYCGLITGRGNHTEPEIAFELFRRAHNRGYATEAGGAIVATAAATGRIRLWATVRRWNAASLRVLQKLDFVDSGKVDEDAQRGDNLWLTRTLTNPERLSSQSSSLGVGRSGTVAAPHRRNQASPTRGRPPTRDSSSPPD